MAQVANPRKQFNFSITVAGLDPFLAQKVTIPSESIEVDEHGDTNYIVKTGGIKKIGTLTIEKISFATSPDTWVFAWMNLVQSTPLGGGILPSLYWRNVIIDEYSTDGVSILNTWTCKDCWPSNRDAIELSRTDSGNTIEKIELQVNEVAKS